MTSRTFPAGWRIAAFTGRLAFRRYAVPALIGLAPVSTMLIASMDPSQPIQPWERVVRAFALPVVAMEILVILLALLGKGRWAPSGLPRGQLIAALALLALMISTATFAAASPGTAFVRTGLWFIHIAFAWSIFRLRQESLVKPATLSSALMAGFLLCCALLILFISGIDDPVSFGWAHDLPGLDNIRRGAYFAAPVAGLCIGRFATARGVALAFPALVCTLAIGFIFWSGARGAVPAVAGALFLGAVLVPALRTLTVALVSFSTSAAGIALAWLYTVQTEYLGFWRIVPVASENTSVAASYDATSGRVDLWAGTWHAILERPLFGHGEGQTAFAVPIGQHMAAFHPHNLLLQVLLAWGFVGALLLLYLALPLARNALATARRRGDCIPPFIAMMVLVIYSAVDGTLFHVHAVSFFAACAGVVAAREATTPAGARPA